MKNIHLILSLFIMVLLGCNNSETTKIKLEPTTNKITTLGHVTKIIQLETKDESMLDYISKSIIDTKNDRIFILSDFKISIFKTSGKFIRRLATGKGPGEITRAISFSIDPSNKIIYVLDAPQTIVALNYNGKPIKKYKYTNFYCSDLQVIDNNRVLLYNYYTKKFNYFVGIYDFKEKKITKRLIEKGESENSRSKCDIIPKFI